MDNNYADQNETVNKAKCGIGAKVTFYIFGVFCTLLSLASLLIIFTNLFGYDKSVEGTVTKISKNRFSDKYDVVIEYSIDGEKKTKNLYLDTVPLGIREQEKVKVKYSSKSKTTYFPEFENLSEDISMFLITATIATVCFIAPHNSKKAANKFLSLERKVRK